MVGLVDQMWLPSKYRPCGWFPKYDCMSLSVALAGSMVKPMRLLAIQMLEPSKHDLLEANLTDCLVH